MSGALLTRRFIASRALTGAALIAALAWPSPARADAFEQIGEGAPVYAAARPVALLGALQRLGVSELPAVQKMRRQLGGIDIFNPAILAAPGIDVAAPMAASFVEPAGANLLHSRVAATLRDPATFTTFLDAVAVSGQLKITRVDPQSPLGKQGVVAAGNLAPDAVVIIRVKGDIAVVDLVNAGDGKTKTPAPAEVARRFPLKPARAFAVGRGARRLFAPESAAVLYADGRKLQPLLQLLADNDNHRELRWASPNEKSSVAAKQKARAQKCQAWSRAPTTFDDVGVALTAAPDAMSLSWAWGTQSGTPLGGLKMSAVEDADLDVDLLGRDATAVVALYAASLAPFAALRRTGLFASPESLTAAVDGCDAMAGMMLLVRSWPLALGTFGAAKAGAASPLTQIQQSLSALRNVVVALRDVTQAGPRFAVGASFDAAARATLELLVAGSGQGAVTTIGKRSPTVYAFSIPGFPRQLAAAMESLAGGKLGFTVADSDDSLSWAFRGDATPAPSAPTAATGARAKAPLLRLAADMAALAKLGPMINAGRDEQALLDMLARLRHVDGELTADGDLFRLTVHAPLKQ
ncbi:MAG: hypothetical protein JWN44_6369 [Myxococcales bacterium]|nr:hypothetical protein [Myxococcales bacterium]